MKTQAMAVPAREFKSKCLALLDRVAATGETILVTKRGRPVARLVPASVEPAPLRASVVELGDITASIGEAWNSNAGHASATRQG